jgi:predicted signal transduction protein with EAL and GGDEF domain
MVGLGQTLDLRVIAEGIEEPGQLDQLRGLGCEFGQGYLFARPGDGPSIAAAFLPPPVIDRGRPTAAAVEPTRPAATLAGPGAARGVAIDRAVSSRRQPHASSSTQP